LGLPISPSVKTLPAPSVVPGGSRTKFEVTVSA
jgi:hypothetical protein